MAIDLGNNPTGTPPTEEQKQQIQTALSLQNSVRIYNTILAGESTKDLYLDGSSTSYEVPVGTDVFIDAKIIAKQSDGTQTAAFHRRIVVSNDSGTLQQIGGTQMIGVDMGSNNGGVPTGWDVSVTVGTALNALGTLVVQFQNTNSTEVEVVANLQITQV